MGVSQGEMQVIKAMQDAQVLANKQSVANVVTFKSFFGPKMDALTGAISSASRSSTFLSWVLIFITVIGTLIAGLSWYGSYNEKKALQSLSDEQLQCALEKSLGKSDVAMFVAVELCAREVSK